MSIPDILRHRSRLLGLLNRCQLRLALCECFFRWRCFDRLPGIQHLAPLWVCLHSVQQMVPVYWGVDVDYLLLHLALWSSMQRVYAYFRGRGPNAQLRAEAAAAAAAEGSNPV